MELRGVFLDPTMNTGLTVKFPRVFSDTEVEPFSKAIKDFILIVDFKKEIHKFQKVNGGILTLHILALGW